MVTNEGGRQYERIEYTPYGETWIEHRYEEEGGSLPYRFTGKELDAETGFYYYGARYLDPKTSRWINADPALGDYIPGAPVNDEARKRNQSLPGQGGVFNYVNLHVYHYAGNNPVKYVDPDGEWINLIDYTSDNSGGSYDQALDYLSRYSPTANTIIKDFKGKFGNPNSTTNILMFDKTEARSPNIFTITWSPKLGLKLKSGKTMSAALILMHEIIHMTYDEYDIRTYDLTNVSESEIEKLRTEIEEKLISDFEKKIATELNSHGFNEGVRSSYVEGSEGSEYIKTRSVTSTD
jgi:RHS repeat-associated protein